MYILLEALNAAFPMKSSHETLSQPQKAIEKMTPYDVRHLAIPRLDRLIWKDWPAYRGTVSPSMYARAAAAACILDIVDKNGLSSEERARTECRTVVR